MAVFPQCYAAVVDKIPAMAKKTLIVDIGSWTIDIMPVINKSPDESKCVTIPKGLITCMRSINEQCVRQLNGEVDESEAIRLIICFTAICSRRSLMCWIDRLTVCTSKAVTETARICM